MGCEAAGNEIRNAVGWSSKTLRKDSWSHTPPGCFISAAPLKENDPPHWNRHDAGNNDGRWSPICRVNDDKPKLSFYLETAGSNQCVSGLAVDEGRCEAACK